MLALTIAFSALGLGSEPTLAAGQAFHFSFSGKGVDAGWTTCPFEYEFDRKGNFIFVGDGHPKRPIIWP